MSDVGTSREAVERLAQLWERSSWAGGGFTHTRAAATLRALLAERDAMRDRLTATEAQAVRDIGAACEQRDATLAEAARLREVLEGIAEYWNGAEGSAVDAAEECRYRADAALGEPTP
jgi:hypothetical protein